MANDQDAAEKTHCFRLTGEADGTRLTYDLSEGEHLLGAAGECDVLLEMAGVSLRQATLTVSEGTLTVRDLDSKNGTFVNGRRIDERTVDEDDWIGFGPVVLYVVRVHPDDARVAIPLDPHRRRSELPDSTTQVRANAGKNREDARCARTSQHRSVANTKTRRHEDVTNPLQRTSVPRPLKTRSFAKQPAHAVYHQSVRVATKSCFNACMAPSTTPTGCLSYTPLGSNSPVVDAPTVSERGIELVVDGEARLFDACAWVPLAVWVLGTALSSTDGREAEARAVLEKAAARAPGTWIATSLTQ